MVITTGNNFSLSGPIQFMYFMISSISNAVNHYFRITLDNINGIGNCVTFNFCTKPSASSLGTIIPPTHFDTQIQCYGGDTSNASDGQGKMVIRASNIGINTLPSSSYTFDINGDTHCSSLRCNNAVINNGISVFTLVCDNFQSPNTTLDLNNNLQNVYNMDGAGNLFLRSVTAIDHDTLDQTAIEPSFIATKTAYVSNIQFSDGTIISTSTGGPTTSSIISLLKGSQLNLGAVQFTVTNNGNDT